MMDEERSKTGFLDLGRVKAWLNAEDKLGGRAWSDKQLAKQIRKVRRLDRVYSVLLGVTVLAIVAVNVLSNAPLFGWILTFLLVGLTTVCMMLAILSWKLEIVDRQMDAWLFDYSKREKLGEK